MPTDVEANALATSRTAGEAMMALGKVWAVRKEIAEHLVHGTDRLATRSFSADSFAAVIEAKAEATPRQAGNGVAVVPIHGLIVPKLTFMSWLMGADYGLDEVMSMVHAAHADPDVKTLVLDVDSPGGMVDGVPEAAARMRQLAADSGKPVVAVANGMMASAAYWLGAQAHEIAVAPSGTVGSVGVYQRHEDISQMAENEGVKVSLVSAGEYKTEGNPFEPLSAEARQAIQSDVNYFYGMFTADVAAGRQVPLDKTAVREGTVFGGGRSYPAKTAVSMGLADREATLSETISRLSSGRAKIRRVGADDGDRPAIEANAEKFELVVEAEAEPPVPEAEPERPKMSDQDQQRMLAVASSLVLSHNEED